MDFRILCSVRGLKLDGIDNYKTDYFILSNDNNIRLELFNDDSFIKKLGTINHTLPFENKTYAIGLIHATDEMKSWSKGKIADKLTEQVIYIGQHLRDFLHFLWFIKDNAISSTMAIGQVQALDVLFYTNEIGLITNRIGENSDVSFSRADLDLAREMLKKYIEICPGKPIEIDDSLFVGETDTINPTSSLYTVKPNKNQKVTNYRIARAWTFITKSRQTHILPMKIALCIPVLECLFCTESNEVTQKVSERVSFYIGQNGSERQAIYKTIKDAYDLRSKYFHGQELSSKHENIDNLKLLSLKMDYLLRKIFLKVVLEDSVIFNEAVLTVFNDNMSNIIFK